MRIRTFIAACIISLATCLARAEAQEARSLTASLPYIPDLENCQSLECLEKVMSDSRAAILPVDKVNWPQSYSYAPDCIASVAYTDNSIVVLFNVSGLDLRTLIQHDNGTICQDSCVEMFILAPDGKNYYNFEMNASGFMHSALGPDISSRTYTSQLKIDRIRRMTSIAKEPIDISDKVCSWKAAMFIPFETIGLDPFSLPDGISANIYKCADKTAHPHYTSWSPIGTPRPNFHCPEYFGTLRFER